MDQIKKPKLFQSMNKPPTHSRFSIHIHEDETGRLTVVCETVGRCENSLDLGCQVMANLIEVAEDNPGCVAVQQITYSQCWQ